MSIALVIPIVMAHIAPSPTENNRYAKIELRHDAVRIVYTIYFGERPGAGERRKMDRNRDGTLDEGESRDFAAAVLGLAGPFLDVELDGKAAPAPWTVADVGLGTPTATGGSFSLDLTLEARLTAGAEHSLWLEDRWPIPDPGETEVRIEAAPGVTVLESHPGRGGRGILLSYRHQGGPDPTGAHGMWMRFTVDASRAELPPPPESRRSRRWLWWVVIGIAVGLGTLVGYRKMKG
jgi:hypothetical protein